MDKISNITSNAEFLSRRNNQDIEKDLDPLSVMVVNRLFNFFQGICPGFDKQFSGNDSKLKTQKINFARAFMDEGISKIEQIEYGVKKCRRESPINIPTVGQFLNWCNPSAEEVGFPKPSEAFDIACLINRQFNDYIHPDSKTDSVIRYVLRQIGSLRFREMKKTEAMKLFEHEYEYAIKKYLKGNIAINEKLLSQKPVDREVNKEKCDEARRKAMEAINRMLK
jgi:hypothetical protein